MQNLLPSRTTYEDDTLDLRDQLRPMRDFFHGSVCDRCIEPPQRPHSTRNLRKCATCAFCEKVLMNLDLAEPCTRMIMLHPHESLHCATTHMAKSCRNPLDYQYLDARVGKLRQTFPFTVVAPELVYFDVGLIPSIAQATSYADARELHSHSGARSAHGGTMILCLPTIPGWHRTVRLQHPLAATTRRRLQGF